MKNYTLSNDEGAVFETIKTSSMNKAREYFKSMYAGKFNITSKNESRRVRFE